MQIRPLLFMFYLPRGVMYVKLCTQGLSKVKWRLNSNDVISQCTKAFPIEINGEKRQNDETSATCDQ